jgi:hypothetical protein
VTCELIRARTGEGRERARPPLLIYLKQHNDLGQFQKANLRDTQAFCIDVQPKITTKLSVFSRKSPPIK